MSHDTVWVDFPTSCAAKAELEKKKARKWIQRARLISAKYFEKVYGFGISNSSSKNKCLFFKKTASKNCSGTRLTCVLQLAFFLFQASFVICTIPPALLGRISFNPPLPALKNQVWTAGGFPSVSSTILKHIQGQQLYQISGFPSITLWLSQYSIMNWVLIR